MLSRISKFSLALVVAALFCLSLSPTAFAAGKADIVDTSARSTSAERPQPGHNNEQTGMSWIEYFQCVRTLSTSMGSWTYAAQQCEEQRPTDTPEVPEKTTDKDDRRSDSSDRR